MSKERDAPPRLKRDTLLTPSSAGAGRPPGFACVVTLVLCLFPGLLYAGPLRSDHNDHTGTLPVAGPASGHHTHTGTPGAPGNSHHSDEHRSGHHTHTGTPNLPGGPHRSDHLGHPSVVYDPAPLTVRDLPSHPSSHPHGHTGTSDLSGGPHHSVHHGHIGTSDLAGGPHRSGHHSHTSIIHDHASLTRRAMPSHHPSGFHGHTDTAPQGHGPPFGRPHSAAAHHEWHDWNPSGSHGAPPSHTMVIPGATGFHQSGHNGHTLTRSNIPHATGSHTGTSQYGHPSVMSGRPSATAPLSFGTTAVTPAFPHATATASDSVESLLQSRDALAKHDYSLVCESSREATNGCQHSDYGYYCTSEGKLRHKGEEASFCERECICVNLAPRPCIHGVILTTCVVSGDGTVMNSQLEAIGSLGDAVIHTNGTLTLPRSLPSSETDLVPTSVTMSRRDSDAADHDYALVCADRDGTTRCEKRTYFCSSAGKVSYKLSDYFCDMVCECKSLKPAKGCVIINAGKGPKLVCASKRDTHVLTVDDGTPSEGNQALSQRDADLDDMYHDYALVCIDKARTSNCLAVPYSCNANGKVIYQRYDAFCSANCKCVSLKQKFCEFTNYVAVACFVSKDAVEHENGTFIGYLKDAVTLSDGTLDFSHTRARRDLQLPAAPENDAAQSPGRTLLFCQNGDHTRTCNRSPFTYCCHAGNLTAQSHDSICDDICKCIDLRVSPQPRYCTVGPDPANHGECYVDGNSVYKIEGEMLTDFIGNFTDAEVDHNANLWFPAPGSSGGPPPDMFSPEPSGPPAIIKRDEDDASEAQAKWVLICINKQHTSTCRKSPFTYSCDGSHVTFRGWDFVCQQICNCVDQDPSQICVPTNSHTGQCPPGAVPLSPEQRDPPKNNPPEEKDLKGTETGDPVKRSESLYHMACYSGNRFNASLTVHCVAKSYTCNPPSPDFGRLVPALHWSGPGEAQCSQGCRCRAPWASDDLSTRSPGSDDFDLVCKGRSARDAIVPGFEELTSRCRNRWGYTCDADGHMQHNGTSVHRCDTSCGCYNNSHNRAVKERSESLDWAVPDFV